MVAGLVIMTTCFTGAVLVFEEELQHLFNKERYYVQAGPAARPLEDMVLSVQNKVPGAVVNGIRIYTDSSRTFELSYSLKKKEGNPGAAAGLLKAKDTKIKPGAKENTRLVAFVNPYTAEVIELYNHRHTFFYSMMSLHRWLLGGDTGKMIVGVCTLIFLFILITGIILWWPKTGNILKQRLKIKWESGWKRLNHDLHIVLGFYSALFLFIFSFTGLAWSFAWFNKGIYTVTNSSMEPVKPPLSTLRLDTKTISYDEVFNCVKASAPAVKYYNINTPKDSLAAYSVSVLPSNAAHESAMDLYFVNRYEPTIIQVQKFGQRNLGQRVRSVFKPIHTASIWGTPSKIIGLIVCIFGVIFPLSGYIMWWLRTNKKATIKK